MGKALESRFGTEKPRSPVQLGISFPQRTENHFSYGERQNKSETIFLQIEIVATIAGEVLISPVAAQANRHLFPCHLANKVSRESGRVGEGLIIVPNQLFDGADLFRRDHSLVMVST